MCWMGREGVMCAPGDVVAPHGYEGGGQTEQHFREHISRSNSDPRLRQRRSR